MNNALLQASRHSMVGCIRGDCEQDIVTHAELVQMIQQRTAGILRQDRLCLQAQRVDGSYSLGQSGEVVSFRLRYRWPVFNPAIMLSNALGITDSYINYTTTTAVRNEVYPFLLPGRDTGANGGAPC